MTGRLSFVATGIVALVVSAASASAGITAFSGQDDGAPTTGPWPMSTTAASSFLSAASAFGPVYTETFEGLPVGTGAQGASFSIHGATVSSNTNYGPNDGIGGVNNFTLGPGSLAGFNVTTGGTNWFGFPNYPGPSVATFTFDAPTNSFGFYTTGVQTFFTSTIAVSFSDGMSEMLSLPVNVNGGVSYFGFTDTTAFTSVSITNTPQPGWVDYWGIDNVSYNSTVVPEPSIWALMLIGFAGIGLTGYRSCRKTAVVAA